VRSPRRIGLALLPLLAVGCIIDRSALAGAAREQDAGAEPVDAAPQAADARLEPALDAPVPPELDAYREPPVDAHEPPRPDAFVEPDARPDCTGRTEMCNGLDDDCDLVIDEDACGSPLMGGGFAVCASHARGDRTYLACPFTLPWDDARRLCQRFSPRYDLVAFADGAEQDAVRAWLGRDSWIGLTDSPSRVSTASNEDFRWVDGTSPSFTAWRRGEPYTDNPDGCVILLTDGTWDAASCDVDHFRGVVCEAALP